MEERIGIQLAAIVPMSAWVKNGLVYAPKNARWVKIPHCRPTTKLTPLPLTATVGGTENFMTKPKAKNRKRGRQLRVQRVVRRRPQPPYCPSCGMLNYHCNCDNFQVRHDND